MELSVNEIAQKLQGSVNGNLDLKVTNLKDLDNAKDGDLSFVLAERYVQAAIDSPAKVILSDSVDEIEGKTVIKVDNAKLAYVEFISVFYPKKTLASGVASSAVIGDGVKLGKNVTIGDCAVIKDNTVIGDGTVISACSFVGEGCVIGAETFINPNVTIYDNTEIGDKTIIHSGVVIGADGFGFVETDKGILKVPQVGLVRIGNNVEIGSNCCIDRGAFGATEISDHVKVDNLVHIAHSVKINQGSIIIAQTGIAGSTKVGVGVIIGGQVGVTDHIEIGDYAQIGSQSGVSKDVPSKAKLSGTPAQPLMELKRGEAHIKKLADLFKQVKEMKAEIERLKEEK